MGRVAIARSLVLAMRLTLFNSVAIVMSYTVEGSHAFTGSCTNGARLPIEGSCSLLGRCLIVESVLQSWESCYCHLSCTCRETGTQYVSCNRGQTALTMCHSLLGRHQIVRSCAIMRRCAIDGTLAILGSLALE